MVKVNRIEVVSALHPVWVLHGGEYLLQYPADGKGVIDHDGVLYCTDADAAQAQRLYGRHRADTDERGQWL